MPVNKKPAAYETSDGAEFDSEVDAIKHQSLLDAKQAVTAAERTYGTLLAETQKTADGVPFNWNCRTYWIVGTRYGEPQMEMFEVGSGCRSSIYDGVLHLKYGFNPEHSAEVGELYISKRNAINKLIEELEQYKAGIDARITQIKTEHGL